MPSIAILATSEEDQVVSAPSVAFNVVDIPSQEVTVSIQGPDVALFEPDARPEPLDPDLVIPDVVALFVDAARLGMWSGGAEHPAASSAEVLAVEHHVARWQRTWRIRLTEIDRGGFRVLYNLLRARHLESISIQSEELPDQGGRVHLLEEPPARFPELFEPAPFTIDYVSPERSKDRVVRIVFASPLDEAETEKAYAALEVWTRLLLLGAYPLPGMAPEASGAIPDLAFLLDPWTIEQSFTELFLCDEAAFVAVVNWATRLHLTGVLVEAVAIS